MPSKPRVEVNMRGYNRVRNQLRTVAAAVPELTDPVIEKHAKKSSAMMRKLPYAPKRPGQKYVRTGKLGGGYRAKKVKKGHWAVTNNVSYAVWVIKKGMQTEYFVNRWYTLEDKLQETMPELTSQLSEDLEAVLESQ